MALHGKEHQSIQEPAPRETITGNVILKAADNLSKYFAKPSTPFEMMQRTIEMCQVVNEILGENAGIYTNGFPFSGGYNLIVNSNKTPPTVQEIQRYTSQKSADIKKLLGDKLSEPYHCLNEGAMLEHTMIRADGQGIDFTEQIYRCPHCNPKVQQIFAPFPDIDIYAIVKEYPSPDILLEIAKHGEERDLFPKYKNLHGILSYFANFKLDSSAPLAIDYFFVTESDIEERLSLLNKRDWINLKVPCQMVRFGTQTFRSDFLELGKNLGLDIQTISSKGKIHSLIEDATKKLLKNDSNQLLDNFLQQSKSSSRLLYTDPVISETVKMRHNIIRTEGMNSIL